jgi:hypothetical protein
MTAQTITPVAVTTTGIAQTTVAITQATAEFVPTGNRNFIVISSVTGTVSATAVAKSPCDMPLSCTASPCNDAGLHNFKMECLTAVTKAFYIPYIDKYIDSTTGKITLNCTPTDGNLKIGIFIMP